MDRCSSSSSSLRFLQCCLCLLYVLQASKILLAFHRVVSILLERRRKISSADGVFPGSQQMIKGLGIVVWIDVFFSSKIELCTENWRHAFIRSSRLIGFVMRFSVSSPIWRRALSNSSATSHLYSDTNQISIERRDSLLNFVFVFPRVFSSSLFRFSPYLSLVNMFTRSLYWTITVQRWTKRLPIDMYRYSYTCSVSRFWRPIFIYLIWFSCTCPVPPCVLFTTSYDFILIELDRKYILLSLSRDKYISAWTPKLTTFIEGPQKSRVDNNSEKKTEIACLIGTGKLASDASLVNLAHTGTSCILFLH